MPTVEYKGRLYPQLAKGWLPTKYYKDKKKVDKQRTKWEKELIEKSYEAPIKIPQFEGLIYKGKALSEQKALEEYTQRTQKETYAQATQETEPAYIEDLQNRIVTGTEQGTGTYRPESQEEKSYFFLPPTREDIIATEQAGGEFREDTSKYEKWSNPNTWLEMSNQFAGNDPRRATYRIAAEAVVAANIIKEGLNPLNLPEAAQLPFRLALEPETRQAVIEQFITHPYGTVGGLVATKKIGQKIIEPFYYRYKRGEANIKVIEELSKTYGKDSAEVALYKSMYNRAFKELPAGGTLVGDFSISQVKQADGLRPSTIDNVNKILGKHNAHIVGTTTISPQTKADAPPRGRAGDLDVQYIENPLDAVDELVKTLQKDKGNYDVKLKGVIL